VIKGKLDRHRGWSISKNIIILVFLSKFHVFIQLGYYGHNLLIPNREHIYYKIVKMYYITADETLQSVFRKVVIKNSSKVSHDIKYIIKICLYITNNRTMLIQYLFYSINFNINILLRELKHL
jgi:hypothetical protein